MKVTIDIKDLFEMKCLHGEAVIDVVFQSAQKEALDLLKKFESNVTYPYLINAGGNIIVINKDGTELLSNEEM